MKASRLGGDSGQPGGSNACLARFSMSHRQGMSYFHYDLETHKETQTTQDSQGKPVQNNSNNNNNNNNDDDDDYHTGITIPI